MAGITELVFVLDRSGSMENLTSETIGGYNSLIAKQKKENEDGKVYVTTVLFDDFYDVLYEHEAIDKVQRLTDSEYYARGCTALLDAVGKTIKSVEKNIKNASSDEKPDKVLFVITTDGYENASREYTKAKIKKMISKKQDKDGWKFMFLGANIDAVSEADSIGIRRSGAVSPSASAKGVSSSFSAVSDMAMFMRKADRCVENFDACFAEKCASTLEKVE